MPAYNIGDTIIFSYKSERSHDPTPKVLVLHSNWQGLTHGVNLNLLTPQEVNFLKAIIDPSFAREMSKKDPRIRQELFRLVGAFKTPNINSPRDFYVRFLKPFIRRYDSYRLYKPMNMSGIKIITKRNDLVSDTKDKGLFDNYVDQVKNRQGPKIQY